MCIFAAASRVEMPEAIRTAASFWRGGSLSHACCCAWVGDTWRETWTNTASSASLSVCVGAGKGATKGAAETSKEAMVVSGGCLVKGPGCILGCERYLTD